MIETRALTTHAEFNDAVRLQQEIWGFKDVELLPLRLFVVATKIDAANPEKLKKLSTHIKRRKLEFHAISAVTGQGIDELKWALAKRLRPVSVDENQLSKSSL